MLRWTLPGVLSRVLATFRPCFTAPKLKGDRIGTSADIAATARWRTVTVLRYGSSATVRIAEQVCLWYGTWRTDPVRVILVRDTEKATTSS